VDGELLRLAFGCLRKQAAPGVDGQSYEDYAANVDQNLKDLYARLKSGRYQAPVIRWVYIPKASGKLCLAWMAAALARTGEPTHAARLSVLPRPNCEGRASDSIGSINRRTTTACVRCRLNLDERHSRAHEVRDTRWTWRACSHLRWASARVGAYA
jgi:hypothetical protein